MSHVALILKIVTGYHLNTLEQIMSLKTMGLHRKKDVLKWSRVKLSDHFGMRFRRR